MTFVRLIVVTFIVAGVLDILTKRSQKGAKKNTKKRFTVRAPIGFAFLGALGGTLCVTIFVWSEFGKEKLPTVFLWVFSAVVALPSLLLMIAPIKGVWDVIVDGDDITVVKAFIFKRHWKFSTIVRCKLTRGGTKVYVQGRRRKAFFVDGMVDGSNLFMKRIEEAGIPLEQRCEEVVLVAGGHQNCAIVSSSFWGKEVTGIVTAALVTD